MPWFLRFQEESVRTKLKYRNRVSYSLFSFRISHHRQIFFRVCSQWQTWLQLTLDRSSEANLIVYQHSEPHQCLLQLFVVLAFMKWGHNWQNWWEEAAKQGNLADVSDCSVKCVTCLVGDSSIYRSLKTGLLGSKHVNLNQWIFFPPLKFRLTDFKSLTWHSII